MRSKRHNEIQLTSIEHRIPYSTNASMHFVACAADVSAPGELDISHSGFDWGRSIVFFE